MCSKENDMMQQSKHSKPVEITAEPVSLETFSPKFLKEQQSETVKSVEKLSGMQRIFYNLDYEVPVKEVAPLKKEELRSLSREEKKAVKKAHQEEVKKQKLLKKENAKSEQEKIQSKQRVVASLEAYLKSPEVMADAKKWGTEKNLNPNLYIGGEDDAINTTILNEMNRIPLEFGLFKKDSAEAAGYTIENMQKIKELNSRIRYKKWRMRAANDVVIPFLEEKANQERRIPGNTGEHARLLTQFKHLSQQESQEIIKLDYVLQNALSELINHKNFKVPADTTANVKKRNYNLEQIHGLEYHYKKGKTSYENYVIYDRITKDKSFAEVLKKTGLAKVREAVSEIKLPEDIQKIVSNSLENDPYTTDTAELLKKALIDNPPPAQSENLEAYKKALRSFLSTLKGFSSVSINYEQKKNLRINNPKIFEDPESDISIQQKEREESELALLKESEQDIPKALDALRSASHPATIQ